MGLARRIAYEQWDFHKPRIQALYLTEDKTLTELATTMEEEYGFKATFVTYPPLSSGIQS